MRDKNALPERLHPTRLVASTTHRFKPEDFMEDVFVISAARTPIGRFGGALKDHSPVDLAAHVMKAAVERSGVEGGSLDLVLFGNILRAGYGQLIPRQASLRAGIPDHVDSVAIDMVCSSGMMAVMQAATQIRAGEADLLLAGGVESMSGAGFYLSSRARWGYKFLMGAPEGLKDILLEDGLMDPTTGEPMGEQAERTAAEHGVTRQQVDEVAAASHRRAAEAWENGWFTAESAPIGYRVKRDTVMLERDEGIRADTTAESLASLRPAFSKEGVLTAGNASQISDGAAALVLASGSAVRAHGLKPLARLSGGAWSAGETWRFSEAPIPAVRKLLDRTGEGVADYELFENNEAFALSSVLFSTMLGVPHDRLNVHGGAVALGHPIGCSGARIVVTLVHALATHGHSRGLAAICHGTGGSTAMTVERV
jgi:acetyl-CoA C-acetyltransferase